jgi:hypothetical protein
MRNGGSDLTISLTMTFKQKVWIIDTGDDYRAMLGDTEIGLIQVVHWNCDDPETEFFEIYGMDSRHPLWWDVKDALYRYLAHK